MKTPLVIKLGGAALSCSETLAKVFGAMNTYRSEAERPLVLVHGGGYLVDDLLKKLALTSVKKQGLRVTPADQIDYVTGALAGTANKLLLAEARKAKIKSCGLSLADGGLCQVSQLDPELGAVGEASAGDPSLLQAVLAADCVPIISSIGISDQGELMNVNADQAAVAVATTLGAELVLLSDVSGVLDGKGHLLPCLTELDAQHLMEKGVITDGMVVKVNAAFAAARELGKPVEIATWRYPEKLTQLFDGQQIGTRFSAS